MLRNALNLILIFALLNVSVQLSTIHDYVRQGNYWGILVAVSYSSTRIDQEEWVCTLQTLLSLPLVKVSYVNDYDRNP